MDATMKRRILADLFEVDGPEAVSNEVLTILESAAPRLDSSPIMHVYRTMKALYSGGFPDYQACNTGYHDLSHAIGTFLTMARLIHGAVLDSEKITEREVLMALTAAGFHDAGYIQEAHDRQGTGAKFKIGHEQRSIGLLTRLAAGLGLSPDEADSAGCLIRCTDMSMSIADVPFPNDRIELLSRMLAAADLLAQLSDPVYLEKLLLLYEEDQESGERRYRRQVDTFRKALEFYELFKRHLARTLAQHDRFLTLHLKTRWNISDNLYRDAIARHHAYLSSTLNASETSVLAHLRRCGTLKALRSLHMDTTLPAPRSA
jgi:hypothetical protein